MSIQSSDPKNSPTAKSHPPESAPAAKKAAVRQGVPRKTVAVEDTQSTAASVQSVTVQPWPEPPHDAAPSLAAKTPKRIRRKKALPTVITTPISAHPTAETRLAHIPLPRPGKPVKPPKLKKPKPVRDSFTMPKGEYQLIDLLKQRAVAKQRHVKKSEILRAGILALANMNDAQLFAALDSVPVIKTGRPRSDSAED